MIEVTRLDDYWLFVPVVTGLLLVAVGHLAGVVRAFRHQFWWGLAALLVPVAGLILLARHPRRFWPPFAVLVVGYLVVGAGYYLALNRGVQTTAVVETVQVPASGGDAVPEAEARLTLTGATRDQYARLRERDDYRVVQWGNADVTDDDLDALTQQKNLRELDLGNTQVTDAGLAKLAGLTRLEVLRLAGTKITAAGFEAHLKPRTGLKELDLRRTSVPKSAAREWKQATPGRRLSV